MGQIDLGSVIGPQGPTGVQGSAGANVYVHFKWAATGTPTDEQILNTPNSYIGVYSGTSSTAPLAASSYQWYNWKGEQGVQGIQGATGSQGAAGPQGATGPDQVTTGTETDITGLLKGNGSTVMQATAGVDYAAASHGHNLSMLTDDSTHRVVTDTEKTAWNAKLSVTYSILSSVDLNTCQTTGLYTFSSNCSNIPLAGNSGSLLVIPLNSGGVILQSAVVNNTCYNRYLNGTWSAWVVSYSANSKPTPADIGAVSADIFLQGVSLNTAVNTGVYHYENSSCTDKPINGEDGTLYVNRYNVNLYTQLSITHTGKMFIRVFYTAWGSWLEVYSTSRKPTASDVGATAKGVITTLTEVNNINREPGIYSVRGVNVLGDGVQYFLLIHSVDQGDSNYAEQVLMITQADTPVRMYIRHCTSAGTWGSWDTIYTSSNKPALTDIATEGTNYCGIDLNNAGKINPARASAPIRCYWDNITLSLADAGSLVWVNNTSAKTVTIPNNSSMAFLIGTEIEIGQGNSGVITISPASGVAIYCNSTSRITAGWCTTVCLKKLDENAWLLQGALG